MNGKSVGILAFILIIIIILVIAFSWNDCKKCDKKDCDDAKKCPSDVQNEQVMQVLGRKQKTSFGNNKAAESFLNKYGERTVEPVSSASSLPKDPFLDGTVKA